MPKPSRRIERDIERLERFRDLFADLIESPDPESRLVQDLAIAAGESREAYEVNGGRSFPVQDGIYLTTNATPMSHWKSAFGGNSDLDPVTVVAAVDLAIGRARQRLDDARDREKGVVGAVAAVLRWPSDLRDAVGPGRGQRRAAQALGVVGQVVVGTLTTALGAGLIQLGVLAYKAVAAQLG